MRKEKKFKIPVEYFESKLEYIKYRLGLVDISRDKELEFILDYATRHFHLGEIVKISQEREDLPRGNLFRLLPKLKDFDFDGFREFGFDGIGFDHKNKLLALSRAIGEYFERFTFFTNVRRRSSLKSNLKSLRQTYDIKLVTDFNRFENPKILSFPSAESDLEEEIDCVLVFDHINKRKALYPLEGVFYGMNLEKSGKKFYPPTSNGCAGGFSFDDAVYSGTLELLERDAFLMYWLTFTSPERLDVSTLPDEAKNIIKYYSKYKFDIRLLNITSDLGVPTVMCHIRDVSRKEWRGVVTSCCNPDPEKAIYFALREGCSAAALAIYDFRWQISFQKHEDVDFYNRISLLQKMNDKYFDFFLDGPLVKYEDFVGRFSSDRKAKDLSWLLEKIENAIGPVNMYSYMAQDFFLKRIGYHVVRIIIPQLIPMYLHEIEKVTNPTRIKSFLRHKGKDLDTHLNDFPHAFP